MLLLTAPKTVPSTQGFVITCANKKLLKPQDYNVLRIVIAAKLHVLTFAVDVDGDVDVFFGSLPFVLLHSS